MRKFYRAFFLDWERDEPSFDKMDMWQGTLSRWAEKYQRNTPESVQATAAKRYRNLPHGTIAAFPWSPWPFQIGGGNFTYGSLVWPPKEIVMRRKCHAKKMTCEKYDTWRKWYKGGKAINYNAIIKVEVGEDVGKEQEPLYRFVPMIFCEKAIRLNGFWYSSFVRLSINSRPIPII